MWDFSLLLLTLKLCGASQSSSFFPYRKCSARSLKYLFLIKIYLSPRAGEPWPSPEGVLQPTFCGCYCCGEGMVAATPSVQVRHYIGGGVVNSLFMCVCVRGRDPANSLLTKRARMPPMASISAVLQLMLVWVPSVQMGPVRAK